MKLFMLSKMKPVLALGLFLASVFSISPACNKQIPKLEVTNQSSNPAISVSEWTYSAQGWGDGTNDIPPGKGVAAPQGNSYYPGSPYSSTGDNSCWVKRALADWDEDNITWNNKPATTDSNRVALPYSTDQWNYNVIDLNVTGLVRDMVYNNKIMASACNCRRSRLAVPLVLTALMRRIHWQLNDRNLL